MRRQAALFLLAMQLLTRLPTPRVDYTPERMAASLAYHPLIGALIGALAAAAYGAASLALPHASAAVIAVIAAAFLTGGLHEDGLADTFDGVGGGKDREGALAIMRDSRLGAYGALALILCAALKLSALAALPMAAAMTALVLGHSLSRLSCVALVASSVYARPSGAAKDVAEGGATSLFGAVFFSLAIAAASLLVVPFEAVLAGLLGCALGHGAMRLYFERKLGGYTGDTLGATQQASEAALYLGVLAAL
ncbi:MAG: adenosylcobinamide-GDP ribazoletransferase [Pseudomonadota bacterium]